MMEETALAGQKGDTAAGQNAIQGESAEASWLTFLPADGCCRLVPMAGDSGCAMEAGCNGDGSFIRLAERADTDSQLFSLTRVLGDWYVIRHPQTGLYISRSEFTDTRLCLKAYDYTDGCLFRFLQRKGSLFIQNRADGQPVMGYSGEVVHLRHPHVRRGGRWILVHLPDIGPVPQNVRASVEAVLRKQEEMKAEMTDGLNTMQDCLSRLFELEKCIWLNDLTSMVEQTSSAGQAGTD